ncbi:MAG: putative nucleotide-diphospho-sugar transferase [Gammaproteobacteria bacterium]|nr:putative nucleotide-diphospho-sugar transferase [Gammaproteobacteria bacterium]
MRADPINAFDPLDGTPVTVVFATFNYRDQLLEWIDAARATCDHWRIVCVDDDLPRWLAARGHGANAVDLYSVLPDAARHDFASMDRGDRMRALMPLRTRLFLHLVRNGRDFIHSDADALWVQDPRPWLARHPGFDLLASQGTVFPPAQYLRHRFVLCAGFFLCRANSRTVAYFETVEAHPGWDDQERMNLVLLNDLDGHWTTDRPHYLVRRRGTWQPTPAWMRLPLAALRPLGRWRLPGAPLSWWRPLRQIRVSRRIVRGNFAGGLVVGVIPWHLIKRQMPRTAATLVQHGDLPGRNRPASAPRTAAPPAGDP